MNGFVRAFVFEKITDIPAGRFDALEAAASAISDRPGTGDSCNSAEVDYAERALLRNRRIQKS